MKKTHKIGLVVLLGIVVLLVWYGMKQSVSDIDEEVDLIIESEETAETDLVPQTNNNSPLREVEIVEESPQINYAYLFEKGSSEESNIVGHFGEGAFGWYVPSWLVANWVDVTPEGGLGLIFAPKVRHDSEQFSNIVIEVGTSTEAFNAMTLYDMNIAKSAPSDIVITEVLLNKHGASDLQITMETNTLIYHIEKKVSNDVLDTYYMDGNGKTLIVSFRARADIFPQFSTRIRDLVGGIGALVPPQG